MGIGLPDVVEAPPVVAGRRGLLVAANEIVEDGNEWIGGFKYEPLSCEVVGPLPINCAPAAGDKPVPGNAPHAGYSPVILLGADRCSTLDRGGDREGRARANLTATESWQAEREWWSGVATAQLDDDDVPNHFLTDGTADVIAGGSLHPTLALALLEADLADCLHGQRGMIHVSPATATIWQNLGLLRVEGQYLLTAMDTIVVAGSGYDGSDPDGDPVDLATTGWAYGTGLVYFRRGAVGEPLTSVDRAVNTRTTWVERPFAVTAAGCCTIAVQVNHAAAAGGVDGGGP